MKVVSNFHHDLKDGVPYNLNLEQFSDNDSDEVLFYGLATTVDRELQRIHQDKKRKVLLNLWVPCEFMADNLEGKNAFEQVEWFDEIYSICPYTTDWMREVHKDKRWKNIFHPFDLHPIQHQPKEFDVCWFGGFHGIEHLKMMEIMQNFKPMVISMQNNRFVTHHRIPHKTKLETISKSKISLIFNSLCLPENNVENIKKYPEWQKNYAFCKLDSNRVPQYKCRMAESAYAKCLMLVIQDFWNVTEEHWQPFHEYIPTTLETLERDIQWALDNYETDYVQNMIEKAYQKSFKHDAKHAFQMIQRGK